MRIVMTFLVLFMLAACNTQDDDLHSYIEEVKTRKAPIEDDVPEITPFERLSYAGQQGRNPFELPHPEALDSQQEDIAEECDIAFLPERETQFLEKFGLDNLKMRGIMKGNGVLWALIQTPQGELHRVKEGDYLGLKNGKIIKVSENIIDIEEMAVDAEGCWVERQTRLELMTEN